MLKRSVAVLAALLVPYLLFVLVIGLNESDVRKRDMADRPVNFDVEKQHQIAKPKKPEPKKERRVNQDQHLPSVKPTDIDASLPGGGLSFGLPEFDQAELGDVGDDDLLGGMDNKVMDKSSVDTPPKVKRRSPIVYPEFARKQGISGFVTMNVLVDEEGNVEDLEIVEAKPKDMFELKAESTVRQWKFEPATYSGKKVKVWAMQKIVFKLD